MSVFQSALEALHAVKSPQGTVQTEPFLAVCRQILPVVDKLGTGFALVKSDVGGNITRLSDGAAKNPAAYGPDLFRLVQDDVAAGTHTGSASCTKGLLWLKRAMEFIVALLERLQADRGVTLSEAAGETYYATLQRYHGWIVTGTFTLALKLVPSRETFLHKVAGELDEEVVMQQMHAFCSEFGALLGEVQAFMAGAGLDDPDKV